MLRLHRTLHNSLVTGALALVATAGCTSGSDAVAVPGADDVVTAPVATINPDDVVEVSTSSVATDEPVSTATTTEATPGTDAPTSAPSTLPSTVLTTTPTTTLAPATTAADPFLRIGDEGDAVEVMQLKLEVLGYLPSNAQPGVFDRATADGLIDFQAQYGIVVDGIFGPQTDRALTAAAQSVNVDG
ncbi:MAG: peptidoglycan-binding protein [Ilumatobacter sp.]